MGWAWASFLYVNIWLYGFGVWPFLKHGLGLVCNLHVSIFDLLDWCVHFSHLWISGCINLISVFFSCVDILHVRKLCAICLEFCCKLFHLLMIWFVCPDDQTVTDIEEYLNGDKRGLDKLISKLRSVGFWYFEITK